MPILDPSLAFTFLISFEKSESKFNKRFLPYFLNIAAKSYDSCYTFSIHAANHLKYDLKNSINFLNSTNFFKITFSDIHFSNPAITNYFKFLFDQMNENLIQTKSNQLRQPRGFYKILDKFNIKFFQPYVLFPDMHAWFFTSTPIAILCIQTNKFCECKHIEEFFELIYLEICIMEACGYALVLCFDLDQSCYSADKKYNSYINNRIRKLISNYNFSEIHFNIGNLSDNYNIIPQILDIEFNGFFYLYAKYIQIERYYKETQNLLRINIILLSENGMIALKTYKLTYIQPFIYCESGLNEDLISIFLSNVPLYDSQNEDENFTPSKVSDLALAYISKKDFLQWNKYRVSILLDDDNERIINKYIDFDDVHNIKADFYVKETLYLADISLNSIQVIEKLVSKIYKKRNKIKKFTEKLIAFSKEKKMLKGLKNAVYAYTYFAKKKNPKFQIHKNQLLTIYESCKKFIFNQDRYIKGIVFQMDTGEGKSCVIQIIAAVLALMGKTVHIASSNINLSNRDYEASLDFFREIKKSSSVLLHENERPFKKKYDELKEDVKQKFPREFYHEKYFNNSSNMNFNVCDKADIIYSTFVNFESYYLHMVERYPGSINDYFQHCSLLIDEADSILIDELTNGTILSHSIKSNVVEVLKYVYDNRSKPSEQVLEEVKKKFPKCEDILIEDINQLYDEIDIVNKDEFSDGKKYSIEEIVFRDKKDCIAKYEKYKDYIDNLEPELRKRIENLYKKVLNDQDKKKSVKSKEKIVLNHIVPFDYDHKGVLEPNKEFSGFIQQFIAIKEIKKNDERQTNKKQNMLIKDLSLNYLYISHPVFVKMYSGVCGFTGTIGNFFDQGILYKQYNLNTQIIPRENPNYRSDFPVILCESLEEKNYMIVSEIVSFHQRGQPVLVIFQDLNDIADLTDLLIFNGIENFNIFDGKDEKVRPDKIGGFKGAVSLGTNVCGRGTNIQKPVLPLHVIITYYTSNDRVMKQAFGRTARQGNKGSVRIICLLDEYPASEVEYNNDEMLEILHDFETKKILQANYIDHFRNTRKWIFDSKIDYQEISKEYIKKMRKARINVNRYKVCNFEYPIIMKVENFLIIQAQKIFSLYNCPNCKYTWMLFQKYIRETIFQSLSITMNKADRDYKIMQSSPITRNSYSYGFYLKTEIDKLYGLLEKYLPTNNSGSKNNICEMVPTFMHIFNRVIDKYEKPLIQLFSNNLTKLYKQSDGKKFLSFDIGFKPFTLTASGSRINTFDEENQCANYISDPELKYYQRKPNKSPVLLSITKKIDQIFNQMCDKINELIGGFIGLNFFLRRTLGGCEFGICYDFEIETTEEQFLKYDYLIDKDPLFLFTISVKSKTGAPILAGVLIFCLVYIATIAKTVYEYVSLFPAKITKTAVKVAIKTILIDILKDKINDLIEEKLENFFSKVTAYLINKINEQIKYFEDEKYAQIFNFLIRICSDSDMSVPGEHVNNLFGGKTILKIKKLKVSSDSLPMNHFFKIGILLLLCFASFMMNFTSHRSRINYDEEKASKKYENENESKKDQFYLNYLYITPQDQIDQNSSNSNDKIHSQKSIGDFFIDKPLRLTITVVQAVNVPKMDANGLCDPYVVIKTDIKGKLFHTCIRYKTREPNWNQEFSMIIQPEDVFETLIFEMKDYDKFSKNESISKTSVRIDSLVLNKVDDNWYEMTPTNRKVKDGGKLRIVFHLEEA